MLNVWILERSDKDAQNQAIELATERASSHGLDREMIHWRVLPESRLWQECVSVIKNKGDSHLYPDIIEYPRCWEKSFEYLDMIARTVDLTEEFQNRWKKLTQQNNLKSSSLLSFPWLIGFLTLSYRKDVLRHLGKTPENLASFCSWRETLAAVRDLRFNDKNLHGFIAENSFDGKLAPADFWTSLWWVWNFAGEFLDPTTEAPAFTQAEAVSGIHSMIEVFMETGRSRDLSSGFFFGGRHGFKGSFPEESFCSLSFSLNPAIRASDPRVGIMLPPKIGDKGQSPSGTVPVREYALAITRQAQEEKLENVLGFLETILASSTWVDLSRHLSFLPKRRDLWEGFFDGIKDPMVSEVYLTSLESHREVANIPFLASLIKIFEETLEDIMLKAFRENFLDKTDLIAHLNRAASEYRLVATLYGESHAP